MRRFLLIVTAILTLCSTTAAQAAMFNHENDPVIETAADKVYEIQMNRYLESLANEEGFTLVDTKDYTVEIPVDWSSWESDGVFSVSKDGRDSAPIMSIQKLDDVVNTDKYLQDRMKKLTEIYGTRIVEKPSLVSYITASNTELTGVTCSFALIKGDNLGHVIEYVNTFGKDVYRFYYMYVTDKANTNPSRKEFVHMIESFQKS